MGVALPPPLATLVFMAAVLVVATFTIAVSGHFPRQQRKPALEGRGGTLVIAVTIAAVGLTAIIALGLAWTVIPWYAAVIGGGLMILLGPYVLHPFPDTIVNGRSVLLALAVLALALDALMLSLIV